jgi:hypothetical protein
MNLFKTLSIGTLSVLMLFSVTMASAKSGIKEDKLKAKKVAFFTQKLNLNSDEAEVFWPVYNEFQEQKENLFDQRKSVHEQFARGLHKMSNSDVEESLDKLVAISKDEASLIETYVGKFKNILPNRKVAQLFIVEEEYKRFLLQQIRNTANNR